MYWSRSWNGVGAVTANVAITLGVGRRQFMSCDATARTVHADAVTVNGGGGSIVAAQLAELSVTGRRRGPPRTCPRTDAERVRLPPFVECLVSKT